MRYKKIIGRVFIFIGICTIISPIIIKSIVTKKINDDVNTFESSIEELNSSEDNNQNLEILKEEMKKYNNDLVENGQEIYDPFSFEMLDFDLKDFEIENNIVGKLEIKKLNLSIPIYLGATNSNLNKGAVHLSHTSLPLGENNSNVVIAAHRGLIRHQMFRHLDRLKEGDEILITNFWEELKYKVVKTEIILPNETSKVLIQENKDMVTLITCHPFRINSHRYVVYCER